MNICTLLLVILLLATYQNVANSQRTCFAGSFRDGRKCSICPPGTFSDDFNQLSCTPCPVGTFRETEGAQSEEQCLPCPEGTASNRTGRVKCDKCRPGTDSLAGSEVCGFCPKGAELSGAGSGCSACIRAFFSDKEGSKFCKRCPDGTFTGGGSDPFPTRLFGATKCDKCPVGTYRRNSEFDFNPVSVFLSNTCAKCQAGTFNDKEGAVSCKLCPPGTFSKPGAIKCTPCPKNTFNNRIPALKCRTCPSGTGTQGMGAAACKHPEKGCTFDTFEGKNGNCQACMPGERLDKRRKICIPCGKNEVSQGGVDTECKACPKNQIPLGDLTVLEKSDCFCKPGLIKARTGCVPCPPGSFWENDNNFFLTVDGFQRVDVFSSPAIRGFCQPCPVGTFSDKPGMLFCKRCPENTFQDLEGSTNCMKCPRGSRSPRVVDEDTFVRDKCIVDETACEAGQVRSRDGKCEAVSCPSKNKVLSKRGCTQCEPNFIAGGKSGCIKCKKNEASPRGAAKNCTKCSKGKVPSRDGICECPIQRRVLLNGKCVKNSNCPFGFDEDSEPSTTKLGDLGVDVCAPCAPRFVRNRETGSFCEECPDNTIAVGRTECVRCPSGEVVQEDIFGRLLDKCRPSDPYA